MENLLSKDYQQDFWKKMGNSVTSKCMKTGYFFLNKSKENEDIFPMIIQGSILGETTFTAKSVLRVEPENRREQEHLLSVIVSRG